MSLSPEVISQLQSYEQAGDAANYYNLLAANGHDYGNLAYEAATDTGLWGAWLITLWKTRHQSSAYPSIATRS